LRNLQQEVGEWVEIYYEHLLKLINCLQLKVTDVFLITIFKACLQPYFLLATTSMKKDTLIKHKETTMICEESRLVITNYNVLIIQLKSKSVA
jgi:hypothetical protein